MFVVLLLKYVELVTSNSGSPQRLSYALVGEAVNVASRIQGLNKEFGTIILFSDSVLTVAGFGLSPKK
jgi:adenylate cyclase